MDKHSLSEIQLLRSQYRDLVELIARLRREKRELQAQNDQLEHDVVKLRTEMSARDQQIQKLTATQAFAANESKSTAILANGEREALTLKVKELLARIDAYL